MRISFIVIAVALFVSIFFSCKKDDVQKSDTLLVNEWILKTMDTYYLWTDEMQRVSADEVTDPIDYFQSLLYTEEDKWSFITDNFTELMASFEGVSKTSGIAPIAITFNESDRVAILILYVYKDSPAALAGLKRGDYITKINGTELNQSNYKAMFEAESYTATIAANDNTGLVDLYTVDIESVTMEIDPVVFDTVYTEGSMKIGYMYLSEFTFIDNFKQNVSAAFNRMGSDLDHLIIDLRFNGGGGLSSAQWLASSVAPKSAIDNRALLVKLLYNDLLDENISNEDKNFYLYETNFVYDFQKITFLTNNYSASASELMIMGLDPYMEISHVGDSTYGKYTSSIPLYDLSDPIQHNYGMFPIVAKYANAEGFTSFKDGLEPTFKLKDDVFNMKPLGSLEDEITAAAYEIITGVYPNTSKSQDYSMPENQSFKVLENSGLERRKDLIID